MYAKLNEPSAPSIPASAAMGSGFSSTPTMPPTLSILSPSVSEREEHAAYLRSKYGIPVLMGEDDGLTQCEECGDFQSYHHDCRC